MPPETGHLQRGARRLGDRPAEPDGGRVEAVALPGADDQLGQAVVALEGKRSVAVFRQLLRDVRQPVAHQLEVAAVVLRRGRAQVHVEHRRDVIAPREVQLVCAAALLDPLRVEAAGHELI